MGEERQVERGDEYLPEIDENGQVPRGWLPPKTRIATDSLGRHQRKKSTKTPVARAIRALLRSEDYDPTKVAKTLYAIATQPCNDPDGNPDAKLQMAAVQAARELADRSDGKPAQQLEIQKTQHQKKTLEITVTHERHKKAINLPRADAHWQKTIEAKTWASMPSPLPTDSDESGRSETSGESSALPLASEGESSIDVNGLPVTPRSARPSGS